MKHFLAGFGVTTLILQTINLAVGVPVSKTLIAAGLAATIVSISLFCTDSGQ